LMTKMAQGTFSLCHGYHLRCDIDFSQTRQHYKMRRIFVRRVPKASIWFFPTQEKYLPLKSS
jgi:hypothetical protein